jgi:hypothetical protein
MPIPSHIDDDHAAAFLAGAGYLTGYSLGNITEEHFDKLFNIQKSGL